MNMEQAASQYTLQQLTRPFRFTIYAVRGELAFDKVKILPHFNLLKQLLFKLHFTLFFRTQISVLRNSTHIYFAIIIPTAASSSSHAI